MSSVPFDPYHKWLGIPRAEQPPHHYRLLGIPLFEDDVQVIEAAADRHMAFLRRYQTGEHAEAAAQVLNEVSRARLCLLKATTKLAYDTELREILAAVARPAKTPPLWRQPAALITAVISVVALVIVIVVINQNGSAPTTPERQPAAKRVVAESPQAVGTGSRHGKPATQAADQPQRTAPKVNGTAISVREQDQRRPAEGSSIPQAKPPRDSAVAKSDAPQLNSGKNGEASPAAPAPKAPVTSRPEEPQRRPIADEPLAVKLPTPDNAAQQSALKLVHEKFRVEYALAKKSEGRNLTPRIALAKALYANAQESDDNPAASFVSYSEAAEWASEAGQLELAWEILEALGNQFDMTPLPLMQKAAKAARPFAKSQEEIALLASIYVRLIEAAIDADDFEIAAKAGQEANSATRKNSQLREQLVSYTRRVSQLRDAYELAHGAKLKLQSAPDDGSANLAWGRYLCFYKNDWTSGLPLLAKSADAQLAALAQRDISHSSAIDEMTRLGDEWWDIASREKDLSQDNVREHAVDIWQSAMLIADESHAPDLIARIDKVFGKTNMYVTTGRAQGEAISSAEYNPGFSFTIEFWVATKASEGYLISKRQQAQDSSIVVSLHEGQVVIGTDSSSGFERSQSKVAINDGRWHHIAAVKMRKRLGLFIDGEVATHLDCPDTYSSNSPWKLGYQDVSPTKEVPARFCRIRLSKEARYLVNFIPEKTYFSDKNTLYVPR